VAKAQRGDNKMIQPQEPKLPQDYAMSLAGAIESVNEESLRGYQPQGPDLAPDIEAIINRYGPSLRLYLRAELSCEDAVDEALQQTWLALYLEGVKSGIAWLRSSAIFGWLRSVAHNRACDYRKQRSASTR
jgi:hypothetical protein